MELRELAFVFPPDEGVITDYDSFKTDEEKKHEIHPSFVDTSTLVTKQSTKNISRI